MAVKVIDKTSQAEVEVSSAEAQAGLQRGDYVLPTGDVRVVQGNRTSTVGAGELADAIGHGWRLADDDEVAAATVRREESDIASQALGGLEATAAGATFGLSTLGLEALGADPERMRARREGLGGLGTSLELAGAIAPTLLTGGAATGAGVARGLGSRAAGLTPAGLVSRGGAAIERGLGGRLATAPALVRTAVPVVGRGAVEGFAAGVGAEIDESVLGERDLAASRLLGAGAMGALFGGGSVAIVPGVAAVGQGLAKVGAKPIRQVLGKASGLVDELGDAGLAKILANPTAREKFAALNQLDLGDVNMVADQLVADPSRLHRYLTEANAVTEELAGNLRPTIEAFRSARKVAIVEGSGAARLRDVSRHLPKSIDDLARIPDLAVAQLDNLEAAVARELDAYAAGMVEIQAADLRSIQRMIGEARTNLGAVARSGSGRGGANRVASVAHNELDRLKHGLDNVRARTRGIAPTRASQNTSELLDGAAKGLRSHLEDATIYGEAGARQATRNRLMTAAIEAERRTRGTASGRLLARESLVDNADLLSTVRNSGRFAGATKTEMFEDAIAAESEYLKWAAANLDLDDATRATIAEQVSAGRRVSEVFEGQRAKVRTLDVLEKWRQAEGNRSVSIGIGSGMGPALLGAAGFGIGGIPGAIAGGALGMLTKPYTMTRKLAAIQAQLGKAERARLKAIGDFVIGTTGAAVKAGGAVARGTARAVARAAPMVAGQLAGGREHTAKVSKRVAMLAANPTELAAELQRMTRDLDDVAPNLAGAITQQVNVATQFLASKAPPSYQAPWSTRPPLVDPIDQARYAKYLEAVTSPMTSIARLSDGTFTREHAEALRVVYPAEYRELQTEAVERLAKLQARGESPSLSRATTLSLLFEVPSDPTQPQAAAIQAAMAPSPAEQAAAQGMPAPSGGGKPPNPRIDADRYSSPTAGIGQVT